MVSGGRWDVPTGLGVLRARACVFALLILVAVSQFYVPGSGAREVRPPVDPSTPGRDAAYVNGCAGDIAGRLDVVCPLSPDVTTYISSISAFPGGVSIALTSVGVNFGLTCEGAAALVLMASNEYSRLPAGVREYDNLLWADPYITSEVMGHSAAAATTIPGLATRGNPIDIVFADYSTPGSQGLFWRSLDNPNHVFHPGTCSGNVA